MSTKIYLSIALFGFCLIAAESLMGGQSAMAQDSTYQSTGNPPYPYGVTYGGAPYPYGIATPSAPTE